MPIPAALAAAGSQVVNSIASIWNTGKQAKHNRELADRQYGHQLDMWNRQNEYNAPAAQMQRFKDAGLNPHLIYGKGSASSGNATTLPQYQEQAPDFSRRRLPNPGDALAQVHRLDLARENALMAKQQSQINPEKLISDVRDTQAGTDLKKSQWSVNTENWVQNRANRDYNLEIAKAKAISSNKALTEQQLDIKWKQLQQAVYQNTTSKGLTLDQSRLQQGWTDILNGNYLTPQAKSIYIDAGQYGLDLLKNIVPAKILQGIRNKPAGGTRITTKFDSRGKRTGFTRSRTINR